MTDTNRRRDLFRQLLAQEGLDLTEVDQPTGSRPTSRPLTAAQRRIWFQQQLDPSSIVYNLTCGVRITGPLDVERLRRAVAGLAHHHTILRTVYSADGRQQSIKEELTPSFTVETVADQAALHDRARDISRQPFDLTAESPMRVLLLQGSEPTAPQEVNVLIVVIHHIAADDASWAILFPELFDRYHRDPAPDHGEMIHYSDCVSWQEQALSPERRDELVEYWRQVLTPAPGSLKLPFDHDRPSDERDERGGAVVDLVDVEHRDALIDLARTHQVTPFMTGLALTAVLLHRHTGVSDVVIGIPAVLRERWSAQSMIGNFQNTLVLRLSVDPEMSFGELLTQVKQRCTDAYAHQDLPFDHLVAQLRPPRRPGRTPWIDVLFLEQSRALSGVSCPGLELEEVVLHNGTSQFDLTFAMSNLPEGLEILSLHRTSLFEEETARALVERWTMLCRAVATDPDQPVGTLPLSGDTTLSKPQLSFQTPCDVATLFWSVVDRFGSGPAVIDGDIQVSYLELAEKAMNLIEELRARQVTQGARVAVLAHPGVEALVAMLATALLGAVHVPIDASSPPERIRMLLSLAEPVAVCTGPGVAAPSRHETIDIATALQVTRTPRERPTVPPLGTPAYIIFTSGSTGEPKGVVVTHRNVARLFSATAELFDFNPRDRWLLGHSLAFDFSVWEVWGAWTTGGTLVLSDWDQRRDPDTLAALMSRHGVTVLNQTPTSFATLAPALLRNGEDKLRWIIFGGEELDPRLLRPWFEARGEHTGMVNMYGITETTVHSTWRRITSDDVSDHRGLSPIGVPLPDLSIDVVDATGAPLPFGVVGEIVVGGAGVTNGYLHSKELTAERFRPDPAGRKRYWSGDLARRRRDGQLDYFGRNDIQLQVRGYRIEPGEVEARLREHPAIVQAAVIADHQQLVAHVVLTDRRVTSEELRSWVGRTLPDHMVPDRLHHWPQLPRTHNGKLDRPVLLSQNPPLLRSAEPDQTMSTPSDVTSVTVTRLWTKLLGVEAIGLNDNFFDLGGHSLLLAQLRDELAEGTGTRLSMAELYGNPTLGAQIRRLSQPPATPDATEPEISERAARQRAAMLHRRRTPGGDQQ